MKSETTEVAQTLQALANEATELSRLLMENDGELTPELEMRLDVNGQLLMQKIDSYNFIIDNFEANAALWKKRKEACALLERRFTTQLGRLWDRIKVVMKEMNRTEIRGGLYRFKLQRSKPKLVIDESKIPDNFKMIIQVTAIDREKIEAAIQEGFEVPGAHFEETGTLRIYENGEM